MINNDNSSSQGKFELLAKETVSPLLKIYSFKKSGLTWNKQFGEFIHVVNIQKLQYNTPSSVNFTINLGVYSKRVYETIWGAINKKYILESDCMIRTRIGPVLENRFDGNVKDHWWTIEGDVDNIELSNLFTEMIEKNIIPFLDKFDSYRIVSNFLENITDPKDTFPLYWIHLAVVKNILEKKESSQRILQDLYNKYDFLRDRCEFVAKNLNIILKI